jgi:hypothetical protein
MINHLRYLPILLLMRNVYQASLKEVPAASRSAEAVSSSGVIDPQSGGVADDSSGVRLSAGTAAAPPPSVPAEWPVVPLWVSPLSVYHRLLQRLQRLQQRKKQTLDEMFWLLNSRLSKHSQLVGQRSVAISNCAVRDVWFLRAFRTCLPTDQLLSDPRHIS